MNKPKQSFKEMAKRLQFGTDNTYKCECGHSVIIIPTKEKRLCRWCGKWVFRDKRFEFKYRLNEVMNDVNKVR